jgi:hypothetical protein
MKKHPTDSIAPGKGGLLHCRFKLSTVYPGTFDRFRHYGWILDGLGDAVIIVPNEYKNELCIVSLHINLRIWKASPSFLTWSLKAGLRPTYKNIVLSRKLKLVNVCRIQTKTPCFPQFKQSVISLTQRLTSVKTMTQHYRSVEETNPLYSLSS